MTSESYVYITLPGQTEAVTAGKYRLIRNRDGSQVGRFVYAASYLARKECVELDPVELRLRVPFYTTAKLNGAFGALRDAAPDFWGRKLIEKRLEQPDLTELDYMLNAPDDRAGALGFGLNPTPPAPVRQFNRTLDLAGLIEIADAIIAAENDPDAVKPRGHDAEQAEQLLRAGTSMGGARPKATVEADASLWLAKFHQVEDKWNNPRVEHAMMVLARECGLSCAETRMVTVGDRDVILVKRFDRHKVAAGYQRSRMVSGLTLLGANDTRDREKWSYLLLADELRRCIGRDHGGDLPELFRRICFNALISNTDDHPRNHAVLAKNREWSLSPAYDLTPNPMFALERRDLALAFGDWGRYANRANLLSQCRRFLLSHDEAERIVDEMAARVQTTWYSTARNAGVSTRDCELIRSAFVYEGFGYALQNQAAPAEPEDAASPSGTHP